MHFLRKFGVLAATLAVMTACTSATVVERPASIDVKPGKGLVYFYREKSFVGSMVSYYVYEGEIKLGALKNGTFFFVDADPGEHKYRAKTEAGEDVTIKVEAGKTYYARGSVKMGVFAGRPELLEVSASEAGAKMPTLNYVVVKD